MKNNIIVALFLFFCLPSFAAHIVGGDIYYDYLGSNQYRFYVSVYRDCNSNGAPFDSPLHFSVFRVNDNARFGDYTFAFTGSQLVPTNFNNPCGTAPTNICTENAIYTQIITLPPIQGGYRVAHQRCCRGPNINNLISPEDTGLTLSINVPGSENGNFQNSSPRFTNYPPLVLCNNDELVFNHSATDAEGDQLTYALVTPFAGGTDFDPMPIPIPAPNYPLVNWAGGYSAANPLGPGSTMSIHPTTGVINAFPNLNGRYVVGIQVQESRNGVVISTMIRDFIFQVFNCNIVLQAILPTQEDLPSFTGFCDGNLTVQFENNSFGTGEYFWDFGVPNTSTDVSTEFAPSFTYPDTGFYLVQLIANPGSACTDTAYMELNLFNELNISFELTDTTCQIGNSFDFTPMTDAPQAASFEWDFGINGNPASSTDRNPQNITFIDPGWQYISVTTNFAICEATYQDSTYIVPRPLADFEMPFNYECEGLTVNFDNTSLDATIFEWDFGFNNETSSVFEPSVTFPAGGSYIVELIARSSEECRDTTFKTLTVNELMTVSFTPDADQCISGNSFDFIGNVTGPPHANFTWDFGENGSISSSNDTSVFDLSFTSTGSQFVTLTGNFDECIKIDSAEIFIYSQPTINFDMVDGLQCAPWTAQFIDLSVSETPVFYEWDFGDGSPISTESNPNYVYEVPGMYPVTLTIRTDEGCIDTLSLQRNDLIHVFPTPISNFSVTPEETHICSPLISFTNQSIDATIFYYWLDEGATFSREENFDYAYSTSGYHSPYLIASNEEGCSDTSSTRIYIEPFSVFIPNSFTPDGDEFNNTFNAKMYMSPSAWNFKIYNRWGEMIFQSFDYTIGWDGTYNGIKVQPGSYQYILQYSPCRVEESVIVLEGHVNLLK